MSSTGMRCAGCGRTLSEHDPLLRCYPPKPNQSNTEHFAMNTHTQTRIASNDVEAAKKDNDEVDWFAAAMKEKLAKARAKGRGGWQSCPPKELSRMLREHVEKGDPVDVANFCMFLWSLEHGITKVSWAEEGITGQAADMLRKYHRLCVEVGRGDSYWLQEILDTEAALRNGQADNTALLDALKKADADFEREGFGEAGPYRAHIRAALTTPESKP